MRKQLGSSSVLTSPNVFTFDSVQMFYCYGYAEIASHLSGCKIKHLGTFYCYITQRLNQKEIMSMHIWLVIQNKQPMTVQSTWSLFWASTSVLVDTLGEDRLCHAITNRTNDQHNATDFDLYSQVNKIEWTKWCFTVQPYNWNVNPGMGLKELAKKLCKRVLSSTRLVWLNHSRNPEYVDGFLISEYRRGSGPTSLILEIKLKLSDKYINRLKYE